MMNIKIKTLAVPAFVALSLVFTACAGDQTIETPDAVDGAGQEAIEGVEQGTKEAGDAVKGGLDNLKQGAEDATGAVEDGAKNLQKGAEDAAGAAQEGIEGVKQEVEEATDSVKDKFE